MALTEQHPIDCEIPLHRSGTEVDRRWLASRVAERAARESLRAQVAKLEHELSGIVAGCFPHVSAVPALGPAGPHLLSLAELERLRDRLVVRVRGAQHQAVRQAELVRRSRDLLERMQEEPGRYKFVRLPVTDLGERGCGVWEVRPRLGLIGMLAGWWELKLSSGCPLPEAARPARAAPPRDRAHHRASAKGRRCSPAGRSSAERHWCLLVAGRGERAALTIGHRSDRLGLRHLQLDEQFAAAALSPSALAHQQIGHRHAVRLPGAFEDDVDDVEFPCRDPPLELGAG
ncbi:MAG: hypothetical protein ACRDLF_01965 [Solirubrobacteraceae bacterium]